ncbi:hypothetical protein BD408DRAFT_410449 [Parasitella parasitica]|nr:hypothetical protein BD408DRAFT_410449 [Parasitella parasitica]
MTTCLFDSPTVLFVPLDVGMKCLSCRRSFAKLGLMASAVTQSSLTYLGMFFLNFCTVLCKLSVWAQ